MAEASARGGYQRPQRPAPVSGPGKMSKRTDSGPARQPIRALNDAAYGEQQTFHDIQAAAPMAKAQPTSAGPQQPLADLSQVVPFGAPTQRPNEPVTAGAASGPGPGMEALGMSAPQNDPGVAYYRSLLPMFEAAAVLPSAGFAFRQFVRRLRAGAL